MASVSTSPVSSPARRRPWAALQTHNYRLFFIGQLISQSGTWVQRLAQSWLVLDLTDSPLALGAVSVLQFLPVLVLSLMGGVLADRWPKRRVLLVTQSCQMLQAFVLGALVVSGHVQLWHVYLLAGLLGITGAADQPARRSFPAVLVPRPHVPSAVALDSAVFNAARVAGPALGGIIIATLGAGGCFLLNGVSFLAVLAALALMRPREFYARVTGGKGSVLGEMGDALSYAWRVPEIALTLLLLTVVGIFGFNFNVILPLLARYALDAGPLGFGGLNSALGLGSVVGSLAVAAQAGVSRRRLLVAGGSLAMMLAAIAVSPSYQLTLGLLFLAGIASVAFSATANINLQLLAPDALRGRILSLYSVLFVGLTPVGAALTGAVAEHWDVQTTLVVNGLGCVLGVAAGLVFVRARSMHALERRPRTAG